MTICVNTDGDAEECPSTAPAIQCNPQHLWQALEWETICFIMTFHSSMRPENEHCHWCDHRQYPQSYSQPNHTSLLSWLESRLQYRRKWISDLKSHTDDNETVLGRNILVQIDRRIHLIRPPWSMTHSFEWIQVIRLELLPWNGNASLGTKSTH